MPRFRCEYQFVDRFEGDEDAIRKAVRDLSFAASFDPMDLNHWEVSRVGAGTVFGDGFGYRLEAKRTISEEIFETSERAAIRKFLYRELPDDIDVKNIRVTRLPPDAEPVPETYRIVAKIDYHSAADWTDEERTLFERAGFNVRDWFDMGDLGRVEGFVTREEAEARVELMLGKYRGRDENGVGVKLTVEPA